MWEGALKGADGDISTAGLLPEAVNFLERSRIPLGISLRGIDRCLRVARTIAALDGAVKVGSGQIREALEFRLGNLNLELT